MGLLLDVVVHPGNIQDRDGAKLVCEAIRDVFPSLQHVWADGGYAGQLIAWMEESCGLELEIVKRTDDPHRFKVLPRRWVVERTFGWFNRYRRLSKEYECNPATSEAMIRLAMIHIMLRRLA